MLSAAFWILQVGYGSNIREINLFVEALFRGAFVDGEEVGTKDQVELLPLLGRS